MFSILSGLGLLSKTVFFGFGFAAAERSSETVAERQFYRLNPSAETVFTILPPPVPSGAKLGGGRPSLAASAV